MDENLKNALKLEDLEDTMVRACSYARSVLAKYYWRGFRPQSNLNKADYNADSAGADDFAYEAFRRLLEGQRSYNSEKSLLENLKSVVESLISSAKKSSDRQPLSDYLDPDIEGDEPCDPICLAKAPLGETGHAVTDAEILDEQRRAYDTIYNSLDGDHDAQTYLEALKEGFDKPQDIAEITGINVEAIYTIRRKLKKHVKIIFDVPNYPDLKRKLFKGS